jgi:PIN domain nuclease of toxin-antitoxin system
MTGYLLDSHVLLWLLASPEEIGHSARRALDAAAEVRFSAASVWELAIKAELGKVSLPDGLAASAVAAGLRELPVTAAHAEATARVSLPHRDPFDRVLVAQAASERLTLLTADRVLLSAGLPVVRDARR